MHPDLHYLHAERFGFFCLLGALVLVACDDPDPAGQSSSPAKGSKADTAKKDAEDEAEDESKDDSEDDFEDDSEDDSPPSKVDSGSVTKPRPVTPVSDPNQIRPRAPPVHTPPAGQDGGIPAEPAPQPDSGPSRPIADASPPRPVDAGR
jgi:hypothetical protein